MRFEVLCETIVPFPSSPASPWGFSQPRTTNLPGLSPQLALV